MIEKYGTANGFGWKVNDIQTAQIVAVPTRLPAQRAKGVFVAFMISLASVFLVLLLAINGLLILFVIRPVNRLSAMATDVSLGNSERGDLPVSGQDEIAQLSLSFNRMGRSLVEAMKMLGLSAQR
jgi:HAMP domain-containing protein